MRVCLLTPGQPSNNPRLVKEADTLAAAGHQVHVICTDSGLWPSETDKDLLAKRNWTCQYVGGDPRRRWFLHRWTRTRYGVARLFGFYASPRGAYLRPSILSRAAPEIQAAALDSRADLYISHHATVLPIAARAARAHGAKLGYDAEDFYSGMWPLKSSPSSIDRLIESIEKRWLPACDYVTAAAPAIADEYVNRFGVERPVTVLNTFPLGDRPSVYRPTDTTASLRLYWFSQCIGAGRGLENTVSALASLKGLAIELHLRGNWQAGYREQLFELAAQLGVADQIHTHLPASPEQMVRLSADYDVGLAVEQLSSRNDDLRLTNKIFTYILAGNAVIGTRTPAQYAFLSSLGLAAATYGNGDVKALATQLRLWYSDRAALDAARRCAWDWGERRYNWDIEQQYFLRALNAGCGMPLAPVVSASR